MSNPGDDSNGGGDQATSTFWEEVRPSYSRWPRITLDAYGFPWFISKFGTFLFVLIAIPYYTAWFVRGFASDYGLAKGDVALVAVLVALALAIPAWLVVDVLFNLIVHFIRYWLFGIIVGLISITIPLFILALSIGWLRVPI